jgi:hypothetical protein
VSKYFLRAADSICYSQSASSKFSCLATRHDRGPSCLRERKFIHEADASVHIFCPHFHLKTRVIFCYLVYVCLCGLISSLSTLWEHSRPRRPSSSPSLSSLQKSPRNRAAPEEVSRSSGGEKSVLLVTAPLLIHSADLAPLPSRPPPSPSRPRSAQVRAAS